MLQNSPCNGAGFNNIIALSPSIIVTINLGKGQPGGVPGFIWARWENKIVFIKNIIGDLDERRMF